MNRINNCFNMIKANEELKKNTKAFLQREREKRAVTIDFRRCYRYAAAFSVFFALLFGVGGYYAVNTPVSYISIDVNPCIELELNRFYNVVNASAYNDDGDMILRNVNLKGKSYTDAIDILLLNQELGSYIRKNGEIVFTVVSDNENKIIEGIQECKGYGQYNGICHGADDEMVSEAHSHGMSLGKYRAYMELSEYDSSITIDDCHDMTMREIRNLIKEHTGENHSDNCSHHKQGGGYRKKNMK